MIFAFGEFELDVGLCVLRRGSEPVAVQPKVFDTLRYLVEHRDRVVSKAELLEALWDGRRLSRVAVPWSIRHARRVLGQSGVERHPIETVRGRGYRFAAEVRASPGPGASPSAPATSVASGDRRPGDPFLGREDVMGRLAQALADARVGRGSLVLLVGEAGIGKTRCANELATLARRSGLAVSTGRCTATEGAPPLWPWIEILRTLAEDPDVAGEAARDARAVLDGIVPGAVADARGGAPPAAAKLGSSRFWIAEAITRSVRQGAKRHPRVLIVEDLHAADDGSVDVLAFLAPDLARSDLLVVATSRDDAGGWLSRRVRPCEVVVLAGLGLGDVERYLGETTGRPAPQELARFVLDRTGGNPLLLKEAARMVVAQRGGASPSRDVALPDVARGFLRDKIASLGPRTREVLDVASVVGEEFSLGMLGRMVEAPAGSLLAAIDDALRSRIIERRSGDTFAFSHVLLRDALYEDLSTTSRARFHRRVATALQDRAAFDDSSRAIAYHLHRALPDANPEEVERYSRLAGDDAMRVCAYAEAAELYRWAIDARAQSNAPDVGATCDLLMSAAYAERQAGQVAVARGYCGRAIELARQLNDGDRLVKAAASLRPTVWLASVPDALVLGAVERALALLPAGASASRVHAYGLLANLPPYSSSVERSRELSGRALRMARELGERSLVLEALVRTFPSLSGPDTIDELLAASDEVLRLDGPPVSWWSAEAFLARGQALMQRSDAQGASRALDAFGECARLLRVAEATWQYDRMSAQRAIYTGDFAEAEARFADLFARSEGFRQYATFLYAAQMNALSWARSGKPLATLAASPGSTPDVAWQWAAAIPAFRAERLMAMVVEGQTQTATTELEELARDGCRAVPRDMSYLYALARLAQAAVALERRGEAMEIYESLTPYAGYSARNAMALGLGCVAFYLGLLARFLGRTADARGHLEEAIRVNARVGDRVHEQQARVVLAELDAG